MTKKHTETVKEAAEKWSKLYAFPDNQVVANKSFHRGSEWREQNMYTEEALEDAWNAAAAFYNSIGGGSGICYKEWITQYKQQKLK